MGFSHFLQKKNFATILLQFCISVPRENFENFRKNRKCENFANKIEIVQKNESFAKHKEFFKIKCKMLAKKFRKFIKNFENTRLIFKCGFTHNINIDLRTTRRHQTFCEIFAFRENIFAFRENIFVFRIICTSLKL